MATCFDLTSRDLQATVTFIQTGNYAFTYKSHEFQELIPPPPLNDKRNKWLSYTLWKQSTGKWSNKNNQTQYNHLTISLVIIRTWWKAWCTHQTRSHSLEKRLIASRCPSVRPSLRYLVSNNSQQTYNFWRHKRHMTISRDRQWALGKKISQTRMFFLDPVNVGLLISQRKSILSSDMTRWIV